MYDDDDDHDHDDAVDDDNDDDDDQHKNYFSSIGSPILNKSGVINDRCMMIMMMMTLDGSTFLHLEQVRGCRR